MHGDRFGPLQSLPDFQQTHHTIGSHIRPNTQGQARRFIKSEGGYRKKNLIATNY